MTQPEVWLRGPVDGVSWPLQPAAHTFLQVREELAALLPSLSDAQLAEPLASGWSIATHVRHLCGATERLLTYAAGQALTPRQLADAQSEASGGEEPAAALCQRVANAMDAALGRLREWSAASPDALAAPREVGRAKLPSTVLGLAFHAAEHAQRHAGQIAVLARVLRSQ